jgi:hypothetical protein
MIYDIIFCYAQAPIFPQHHVGVMIIRTDHDSDSDRVMDPDEQRDYADQGPRSDSDLDGDTQILATLLKLIPGCIDAADIELLLQGIPVQLPVVGNILLAIGSVSCS